jgi:hypothetical protein
MEHTIPDGTAPGSIAVLSYALFHCHPLSEPPFNIELGFCDKAVRQLNDCIHIPDAIEKLENYCQKENILKSAAFTLLYPIYLEAMDTDAESTMHHVAWLIKEQADKHQWQFGRTGGYTGKMPADFIS